MNLNGITISVTLLFSVIIIGFKSKDLPKKSEATKNDAFEEIFPNIYLYKDISNVYILRSGNSAMLIDAGSGKIINHLKEIGVHNVEWILQTHYHRDQCIGNSQLKKSGAKVAVSELEAPLLDICVNLRKYFQITDCNSIFFWCRRYSIFPMIKPQTHHHRFYTGLMQCI